MPKFYGRNWGKHTVISSQPLTPTQQYMQEHLHEAMAGKVVIPQEVKDEESLRKQIRQCRAHRKCLEYKLCNRSSKKYEIKAM